MKSSLRVLITLLKEKGFLHVIRTTSAYLLHRLFYAPKYFVFHGKKYRYFFHPVVWRCERVVEIPVILEIVKSYSGKSLLEVGNVLSNYLPVNHTILDKYEIASGVINEDCVSFAPSERYDLIVSISTLEHVGWDEKPLDHFKILPAVRNLYRLLRANGKIIFTVPLGYNPELDACIKTNKLKLTKVVYLKRISKHNVWKESSWNEVKNAKYNWPFACANALCVCEITKPRNKKTKVL